MAQVTMELPKVARQYAESMGLVCDISSGCCVASETTVDVEIQRSVRDVDLDRKRTFVHALRFRHRGAAESDLPAWEPATRMGGGAPAELPAEVTCLKRSPTTARTLRVLKVGTATCLEVWEGADCLFRASAEGTHEAVCGSSNGLGGIAWSRDGGKVAYIAERPAPPAASFFAKPKPSVPRGQDQSLGPEEAQDGVKGRGSEFVAREDWGEKCAGSDRLGLFLLDVGTAAISELAVAGAAGSVTPAEPVFSADGSAVIVTCFPHPRGRKLGSVYCFQRPCHLRRVPVPEAVPEAAADASTTASATSAAAAAIEVLTQDSGAAVAFSPRLSHGGRALAFLASPAGAPFATHVGPLALCLLSVDAAGRIAPPPADDDDGGGGGGSSGGGSCSAYRVLVAAGCGAPALDEASPGGFAFPGLWLSGSLPELCWGAGDATLWVSSLWGSRPSALRINAATGAVTRAAPASHPDAAVAVLTALPATDGASGAGGGALVSWSTPLDPGGVALVVAEDDDGRGTLRWVEGPRLGCQAVTAAALGKRPQPSQSSPPPAGASWRVLSAVAPDSGSGVPMEAVLVLPPPGCPGGGGSGLGLVVVPHGGPHSATPTSFLGPYAFLAAATGCGVLHVNYRGSIGFGGRDLGSLPGRVGDQDVRDMVRRLQHGRRLELSAHILHRTLHPRAMSGQKGTFSESLRAHRHTMSPSS